MGPWLEVRDLDLALGRFALRRICLTLDRGDYLMLLGPSGCGKTSLLRAVAGVYRVEPGRVFLEGRDIGRTPPHRRRIAYVSQTADLFPHLTVAENIAFGLRYLPVDRRERSRRVEEMAERFGVRHLMARYPGVLSGGEGKRVALARGLVIEPRALLLDEPLAGVDPNARAELFDVLRMIHDDLHTATIHVTHDREETRAVGEHGAVMREGRIEQAGALDALYERPRTAFVAEFMGEGDVFPARFVERDGRWTACTAWGELPLSDPPSSATGYVLVCPDTLAPSRLPGVGTTQGVVRRATPRGVYTDLLVEVGAGRTLRVHVAADAAGPFKPGDRIALECRKPPCVISEPPS